MASSRDHLVGRPLVPFFDADDNVNEALDVDHSTRATEQLDVDARVWDRELGYFVYPTAQPERPLQHHSQPIAIKPRANESANDSSANSSLGRALLTPEMLFSRSAPTATVNGIAMPPAPLEHDSQPVTPRSASAKRASRQKTRSGTPTRSRNNKQRTSPSQTAADGGSSGGEGGRSGGESSKNGAVKTSESTPKKTRNKKQEQTKATEDLSSNGKWAWSAFQSSPDPKSLPLPPFAVGNGGSPSVGALPPPKDPPKIEERLDPPPSLPPDVVALPSSIEHSMTQDLRRLLNIGS